MFQLEFTSEEFRLTTSPLNARHSGIEARLAALYNSSSFVSQNTDNVQGTYATKQLLKQQHSKDTSNLD